MLSRPGGRAPGGGDADRQARSATSPPRTRASTATPSGPSRPEASRPRSSRTTADPFARLARRYARTHGPFTTRELTERYGVDPSSRAPRGSSAPATWCAASCGPGAPSASGATPMCCAGCAAPRSPRCARRSSPPSSRRWRASCPSGRESTAQPPGGAGVDRLREVLVPLQGLALAPEVWERDVLPRRAGAYSPAWLDQLCASGELVWVGAGSLGRRSGKVALYFREDARWLGPPPIKADAPSEPLHERIRERLARGAAFWTDLLADSGRHRAGRAAGGALGPRLGRRGDQRRVRPAARAPPLAGRPVAQRGPALRAPPPPGRPAGAGPLVAHRAAVRRRARSRRRACAPWPRCCSSATGWSPARRCSPRACPAASPSLYGELANLETLGTARRGYFVEGLGGAQFALPAAIERLRGLRADEPAGALVLAATDPANPFGATLPWPKREDEARPAARAACRAPTWSRSTPSPCSTSSAAERDSVALRDPLEPTGEPADWLREALEALADHVRRGRIKRAGARALRRRARGGLSRSSRC